MPRTLSNSLSQLQIDNSTILNEIGMNELVEWLRESKPKLGAKFEKYILSVGCECDENSENILEEARNVMSEVQYEMVIEGNSDAENRLIKYKDLHAVVKDIVDNMPKKFSFEERLTILEVGAELLNTNHTWINMKENPILYDEWGLGDETYLPDENDEEDGYRDDDIEDEEEWIGEEEEYIHTLEKSTLPVDWQDDPITKPNIPGSAYMLVEMSKRLGLPYPNKSEVQWYMETSRIYDRKHYDTNLAGYVEHNISFMDLIEGPIGGNKEIDSLRILYIFLSILIEQLEKN